jgi:hypothetical protein
MPTMLLFYRRHRATAKRGQKTTALIAALAVAAAVALSSSTCPDTCLRARTAQSL